MLETIHSANRAKSNKEAGALANDGENTYTQFMAAKNIAMQNQQPVCNMKVKKQKSSTKDKQNLQHEGDC